MSNLVQWVGAGAGAVAIFFALLVIITTVVWLSDTFTRKEK